MTTWGHDQDLIPLGPNLSLYFHKYNAFVIKQDLFKLLEEWSEAGKGF